MQHACEHRYNQPAPHPLMRTGLLLCGYNRQVLLSVL